MATGVIRNSGATMAPADVTDAGADSWAAMTGVSPMSPAVGGPGLGALAGGIAGGLPYDVDGARSRIVSNDSPVAGPVAGHGGHLLDDWRDVFNWKGSPVPWLLILTLVMVGFAQFRIQARAGKFKAGAALG